MVVWNVFIFFWVWAFEVIGDSDFRYGGIGGITVVVPYNFVGNECEIWDPFIVLIVFFEGLICIGRLGAAGHEDNDSIIGVDVIDVFWYFGVK